MSNIFTQNPIYLDTDTTTGAGTNWRGASGGAQLNPGNLPSNIQQLSGSVSRMWGIRPIKILVGQADTAAALVAGNIVITDPQTSGGAGQLLKIVISTAAITTQVPFEVDMEGSNPLWRDFIVTGLTATKASLQILYRL